MDFGPDWEWVVIEAAVAMLPSWWSMIGHGYSHWDKLVPTHKVVCGRTVVGIYFSADWCTRCVEFTPLLMNLYASHKAKNTATTTSIPPFEVILILQCWDAAATEHYFSAMP